MEIISYVGASSVQRRKTSFHLPNFSEMHVQRARPQKLKFYHTHTSFDALAKRKNFFSSLLNVRWLLKPVFYKYFIPVLAMCILVPMTMVRVTDYIESHGSPVLFETLPDSELEVLTAAMAKFAMETNEDAFDENGNVLSDDGKILTPASLGIGQAVTYSVYTVKSGDAISTIARKFGLGNISTLIAINDIDNVRTLRAGQKLRVPSMDGLIHCVKKGESLNSISVKYHVSVEELADTNDLSSLTLSVGQELFIPGAKMDSTSLRKAMGELFTYPIKAGWRLTSRFGTRKDPFTGVKSSHTGIDMACPTGTPIYAAMSGTVVYSGWSNIFGNYVIINHGNGYQTLYGHMSKILARKGQSVSQGTRIGLVGSTGYSTGPHLHLTVYKNGKLVDPLTLLK
ncbi:MAG: M23 family metallopeptidase [Treponema sp.]|nr:M23 family metallopeptidase [Treponema sp.]